MPGKLFALVDELLIALTLFSNGLKESEGGPNSKVNALSSIVFEKFLSPAIVQDDGTPDMLMFQRSLASLRLFALCIREPTD